MQISNSANQAALFPLLLITHFIFFLTNTLPTFLTSILDSEPALHINLSWQWHSDIMIVICYAVPCGTKTWDLTCSAEQSLDSRLYRSLHKYTLNRAQNGCVHTPCLSAGLQLQSGAQRLTCMRADSSATECNTVKGYIIFSHYKTYDRGQHRESWSIWTKFITQIHVLIWINPWLFIISLLLVLSAQLCKTDLTSRQTQQHLLWYLIYKSIYLCIFIYFQVCKSINKKISAGNCSKCYSNRSK